MFGTSSLVFDVELVNACIHGDVVRRYGLCTYPQTVKEEQEPCKEYWSHNVEHVTFPFSSFGMVRSYEKKRITSLRDSLDVKNVNAQRASSSSFSFRLVTDVTSLGRKRFT